MRSTRIFSHLGWPLLILVCLLPVLQWALIVPIQYRFAAPVPSLLALGQVSGLIGLAMYAFNLLLSTRLRIFEELFGGLNKVYIAHHIIGGLALVFLMVHPVMLALRLVPSSFTRAAELLLPRLADIPVALGILSLWGTIALLYLTFFVALPYKLWLLTHKFLGAFFFLGGLHTLFVPNDLSRDPILQVYMLGLVGIGIGAFAYRTLLPSIMVRRFAYMVRAAVVKAPGVIEIDLVPARNLMNFRAGQFVFVSFRAPGISREWHPFTISSAPGTGDFTVTIKSLGSYTRKLTELAGSLNGAQAMVEGAYGRFSFRYFQNPAQVWVGGGIGITPFLSMAKSLANEPGPYNIDLYYSVKSESELIDINVLAQSQVAAADRYFRVIPFVADKQGFLTAKYIAQMTPGLAGRDVLICGPPAMMQAMRKQLRAAGVPNGRIHTEEFAMS